MRPFRGLRYDADTVGDVGPAIAPPYDVVGPREAQELLASSPYSSVRLELSQDTQAPDPRRYQEAAETLRGWLSSSVLKLDAVPAFYRWEQGFFHQGRLLRRQALLAVVRLERWQTRAIRPHEDTSPQPKVDRLLLLRACHAHFSPVFGLYRDAEGRIAHLLEAATSQTLTHAEDAQGVEHRVSAVTDGETIEALRHAFAREPLYLADGHHRYETALTFQKESPLAGAAFVPMALVRADDPALLILPTHRLVGGLSQDALQAVREGLQRHFHLAPQPLDAGPGSLGSTQTAPLAVCGLQPQTKLLLYPKDPAHLEAQLPATRSAAWRRLPVSLLHGVILDEILRRTPGAKLALVEDAAQAVARVEEGEFQLAFFLRPPSPLDVLAVADAGERMPEKSTYFYPKFPAGVVMYHLEHPPLP